MESSSVRSSAPESQLISRRAIMRAGAATAWTVPVVVMASPAWAGAVVSGKATLGVVGLTANYVDSTHVRLTGSVTNTGATAINLQLTVSMAATASSASVTSGNWSPPSSFGGTSVAFTAAPVQGDNAFNVLITVSSTPVMSEITATATANNQAGAAASTVPVGAAPQSSALSWQSLTSAYDSADASKLVVSAVIAHTGAATSSLTAVFKIPAGKYDTAPNPPTAAGWGTAAVSGSSGAGWTVTFTSADQLSGATTKSLSTTIALLDGVPATKFAGSAFTLDAVASGGGSASTTCNVAAATPAVTALTDTPVYSGWSSSGKKLTANAYVKNTGSKTVFKPRLTITFSRAADGLATGTSWTVVSGAGTKVLTVERTQTLLQTEATTEKPVFTFTGGNPDPTITAVSASVG